MEGAAHRQRDDPPGARPLGGGHRLPHRRRLPGQDHLAGGVEVGGHHLRTDRLAQGGDGRIVEAEDGGHPARPLDAGGLHQAAPLAHQGQALREIEDPRRGQGRVLAQAVAGHRGGMEAAGGQQAGGGDAVHVDRRLGDLGLAEPLHGTLEADAGELEPEDAVGLLVELPDLGEAFPEIGPHAHELGSLARKEEGPAGAHETRPQRSRTLPQVRPAPTAVSCTRSPGSRRPSSAASERAMGTVPAVVLA